METTPSEYPFIQEESIDLKKFLFKILYNWYWFAIAMFFALTIAYLVNRYADPLYSVTSTIIVRDDTKAGKGQLSGYENVLEGMDIFRSKKNIYNEMGILQSYSLTHKALSELKDFEITYMLVGRRGIKESSLYNRSPFFVEIDTSHVQMRGHRVNIFLLSKEKYRLTIDEGMNIDTILHYGDPFINENFSFRLFLRNPETFDPEEQLSNKYYFVINDLNSLTNQYKGKLSITVNDKKGSILILTTQGQVAQQECDYLNKLGEVYIRSGLEEKNRIATNTINFIDEQMKNIVDSLRKSELKLENFRIKNDIIDISKEGMAIYDKISEFQSQKAVLEIQKNYYQYVLKFLEESVNVSEMVAPSVAGINDPVLISLIQQLIELYSQKTNLQITTQPNSTGLQLVNQKIYETRKLLVNNVKSLIHSTELSLQDIDKNIDALTVQIKKLPIKERQLLGIERVYNIANQIYTYLLEKRAEAGIAKASNVADNKILDIARPENASRVKPKTSLNYMIALVLGFIIPLTILLLLEYFNNKVVDKKDIESKTRVPILGTIGHNTTEENIPVLTHPKSALAESFRALRTNLQYKLKEKSQKIIVVTSTISGEGKTFAAENLAVIIAMSGKKTLLASFDLRKPKIHRDFNINNEIGLSSYLANQHSYEEMILKTDIENLYVATSGEIPPNPAELLESPGTEAFFSLAKKDFDYIVVDTPPLAIVTDTLLLIPFSDTILYLVRQNYSSKDVIPFLDDLYEKQELKKLGILVNDIKLSSYYGYSYGYGYGYGYGYHYGYGYGYGYGQGYYEEEGKHKPLLRKIFHFLFHK
ncbi:MAG: polysaccharide biosynthesis tyrosine autokinase [Bacteroidales bacterium]|nr:polysaccharide biosynthesis tyrosine autokinase [Bacteroidales bacterium]